MEEIARKRHPKKISEQKGRRGSLRARLPIKFTLKKGGGEVVHDVRLRAKSDYKGGI